MGRIYAICGPSGAGKSTVIRQFLDMKSPRLTLLPRTTARPRRPNERSNYEYEFTDAQGFLRLLFARELVDFNEYDGHPYGIRQGLIDNCVRSKNDGLIMSGTSGAINLKLKFPDVVTVLHIYTGTATDLLHGGSLEMDSDQNLELIWRLRKKINEGVLTPKGDPESYITSRMARSFLGIALISGHLRANLDVNVIHNERDKISRAVNEIAQIINLNAPDGGHATDYRPICFTLMPFNSPFNEIYEDHIHKVVESIGFQCLRADRIFSTRPVMEDIRDVVRKAQIIISDLTGNNPNVYYETGLCHALRKQVILITQDDSAPFDVQHFRRIPYIFTPRGMTSFEERLEHTIKEVASLSRDQKGA